MTSPAGKPPLDGHAAQRLARDLRAAGVGEVRFDDGSRALYATDASNYRQTPIGVVIPRTVDDIVRTVEICRRHGAPVLPRGGGTSLAGQCCNVAVVVDTSKYLNRILSLDPQARVARVEPGCVLDDLRDAAEKHHLTFGPDPSTHDHNTLGGMVGNNSCGVHSVMAGRTVDNVRSLDILTYDGLRMTVGPTSDAELARIIAEGGRRGEIYAAMKSLRDRFADQVRARYPKIPRRVSGYNLDELLPENGFDVGRALVGTEGTCVFILSAELRLVYSPPKRTVVVLGYDDVYTAGDHVPDVLAHHPIALEGIGEKLPQYMRKKALHVDQLHLLPEGGGWLLVEFGGDTQDEADDKAHRLVDALDKGRTRHAKVYSDSASQASLARIRKSGLGATAEVPGEPDAWEGWEDAAVPPAKVGPYLRDFRALLDRYRYGCALYGHFGDGCIHVRINFDLVSRPGIEHYRAFIDEAADLVLRYGGSLSGEHGDGQSRAALLPKMYGPELVGAFREFKAAWDPDWKMNPGKIVDPYPPTSNLRLGADYRPALLETVFDFADDDHDFSKASLRCVGVGECRRHSGGVMCPSYRATREEKHSTRGRAHLLFEMVNGRVLKDQWRSEAVREALDLCLACKGCKKDCPVNVDMATYKAEFFHHYYEGRLRPRDAYSMGRIYDWARLASHMPRLVNFIGAAPGLGAAAKFIGGIAQARQLPAFAPQTFRAWFNRRRPAPVGGRRIVLWPDTFNNHFHPEAAIAAVEVLEDAGYRVTIPPRTLCCARPLFAWGMLDRAKAQLAEVLEVLRPEIEAGVPVVGLEPACVASFRDELPHLFPRHPAARRLAEQTVMFSELLARDEAYRPRGLGRPALMHVHCNQHAVMGAKAETELLRKLGVDVTSPDSGCCGMAGSFGFEAAHYDVAMTIGEQALLPAVRQTPADTLLIANGFSCQEQIFQATGRRALNVAQIARLAADLPTRSRWERAASVEEEPGEHHEIQAHQ